MKKLIRLTENDLHRIVKQSIHRLLRESGYDGDTYPNFREDPDLAGFRTFRPSEKWEDWNEENFMGGQDENEDHFDSLTEYVTQEVQRTAQSIIEECEILNEKLKNGEENENDFFRNETSFFIDDDNCAYAVISPSTSFEMNIKLKTYRGLFGSHYSLDTPDAAEEDAEHFVTHGFLQYNLNKKESNKLYVGLIKAIINNSLHKEDFNMENQELRYTSLIKNNPTVKNVMSEAYRALVKTHKTLVKKYGGNEIPTKSDAPFGAEFVRQMNYYH